MARGGFSILGARTNIDKQGFWSPVTQWPWSFLTEALHNFICSYCFFSQQIAFLSRYSFPFSGRVKQQKPSLHQLWIPQIERGNLLLQANRSPLQRHIAEIGAMWTRPFKNGEWRNPLGGHLGVEDWCGRVVPHPQIAEAEIDKMTTGCSPQKCKRTSDMMKKLSLACFGAGFSAPQGPAWGPLKGPCERVLNGPAWDAHPKSLPEETRRPPGPWNTSNKQNVRDLVRSCYCWVSYGSN